MSRYERHEKIGSGGQGSVYRGWDTHLNRDVAIKVLNIFAPEHPDLVDAFSSEAQSAAGIMHDNVVTIFDYGIEDDEPFIVMELLPDSVAKRIKANGQMSFEESVGIAIQVCRGLAVAHEKIIHRDLKPLNILLNSEGKPKISDFGMAQLLEKSTHIYQAQVGFGTYAYMSPEQWEETRINRRSDIYSVGISLYEMLTGQVPFIGPSISQFMEQHKTAPVPPLPSQLNIPSEVESVIRKALEKSPEDRYADANDMADALDAARMSQFYRDLKNSQNALDEYEANEADEEKQWVGSASFTGSLVSEHPNVARYRFANRPRSFDIYVPILLIDACNEEYKLANPKSITAIISSTGDADVPRPDTTDTVWGYNFSKEHSSVVQYLIRASNYQETGSENYRIYMPKSLMGDNAYPLTIQLSIE